MLSPESIEISLRPSIEELELIRQWLVKEEKETGKGFYCNWRSIQSSYDSQSLTIATLNKQPIGFIAFDENDYTTTFNIVEVHPDWRKKGVGQFMISQCLKHLLSIGIAIVDLQCNPQDSESFWRKIGFIEFPDSLKEGYSNKWLFKLLMSPLPTNTEEEPVKIELWNKEPHQIKDETPTWVWYPKLLRSTGQLALPIIQTAHHNWRIRVSVRNEPKFDGCIKYIDRKIPIACSEFIMIKDLHSLVG